MTVGAIIVLAEIMVPELLVAVKWLYIQITSLLSEAREGEDT
jgi:hypothetical protein